MNIKEQIKQVLVLPSGEMSNYGDQLWNNFIYGSYGESDYINSLKMKDASNKKQRSFVIQNFTSLVSREFFCSYGYAQKVIVSLFPKEKLASITNGFINDLNNLGE